MLFTSSLYSTAPINERVDAKFFTMPEKSRPARGSCIRNVATFWLAVALLSSATLLPSFVKHSYSELSNESLEPIGRK